MIFDMHSAERFECLRHELSVLRDMRRFVRRDDESLAAEAGKISGVKSLQSDRKTSFVSY
jgi:hypothetical protein